MPYKGPNLKDAFLYLFIIIKLSNKAIIYKIHINNIINNYSQMFWFKLHNYFNNFINLNKLNYYIKIINIPEKN